ncbi:MAG: PrsW family glutamic-type intramembrane protease, partial [Planctomycetota bacterium]
ERVSGRLAASAGNGAGGANGSGGAAGATGSGGASDSGGTGRVDAWGWRNAAAPVYWGAMVAAGFACFENVLYALHTPAGSGQEYAVIAVRAVTSSLVHCAATSMVGLAVGVALRFEFPRAGLALAAAAGLLCAVLIHAGYNVLTQMPFTTGHARLMVEACAAVLGSSFPPLLAYAFGLIGSGTISSRR